jgi:pre-mRNA-splicing factor ATP-dependent RNA helicase DHX15/PRP43
VHATAAKSVVKWVVGEIDVALGDVVGFTVRFDSKTRDVTWLVSMTDSFLLHEFVADRELTCYDVVITDEAHERTVNTDVVIGLLKQLCGRRPNLRVMIMHSRVDSRQSTLNTQQSSQATAP